MANFTPYFTLLIAVNDYIQDAILPGNTSGWELVTNVSSSLDATTNRNVYTITTASHTIVVDYSTVVEEFKYNPQQNSGTTVRYWVVGQNAVTL